MTSRKRVELAARTVTKASGLPGAFLFGIAQSLFLPVDADLADVLSDFALLVSLFTAGSDGGLSALALSEYALLR